jgi:hypothetical protein
MNQNNNAVLNNNDPNNGAPPAPVSMIEYISRYVIIYLVITTFSQKLFTPKVADIITPDKASDMNNIQKKVDLPFAKYTGIKNLPTTRTFPTHDEQGVELGPHACIFGKNDVFDLSVFLSNSSEYDSREKGNLVIE